MLVEKEKPIKFLEETQGPLYKAILEGKVDEKYIPEGFFEMNEFLNSVVCYDISYGNSCVSYLLRLNGESVAFMSVSYLTENTNKNYTLFRMKCGEMKIKDFIDIESLNSYEDIVSLVDSFRNCESCLIRLSENCYFTIRFYYIG